MDIKIELLVIFCRKHFYNFINISAKKLFKKYLLTLHTFLMNFTLSEGSRVVELADFVLKLDDQRCLAFFKKALEGYFSHPFSHEET